jgi:hypothetical protein
MVNSFIEESQRKRVIVFRYFIRFSSTKVFTFVKSEQKYLSEIQKLIYFIVNLDSQVYLAWLKEEECRRCISIAQQFVAGSDESLHELISFLFFQEKGALEIRESFIVIGFLMIQCIDDHDLSIRGTAFISPCISRLKYLARITVLHDYILRYAIY